MLAYVIRRLLYMIPVLVGVALLIFVLFNVAGEDPVRIKLGNHATAESIAALEAQWGLDKSYPAQFGDFLLQIVSFDYGESYDSGETLSRLFKEGAVVSLSLTVPPFLLGIFINVSVAMLVAYYRGGWIDRWATAIAVMAMSVSYLVYIISLQYLLAYAADLFPIDAADPAFSPGLASIPFLFLPWMIFILVSMGPDIRIYRTMFLDEIGGDYVRTARAKGAGELRVLFVHVLKNASIPILTYTVVAIPFLILGAFLMERFFSLPGVGNLLITAINTGDFPILKGLTMYIAIGYSLFNLLTDVLYAYVDPRVKLS